MASRGRPNIREVGDDYVGSGGGGGDMEARLAKLEAHIGHIQSDMSEVKGDLRALLYALVGGFLILAAAGTSAFLMLNADQRQISERTAIILDRLSTDTSTVSPSPTE